MKRLHIISLSPVLANSRTSAKAQVAKRIKQRFGGIKTLITGISLMLFFCPFIGNAQNTLRAPAYPLVTIDPYTSAWSCTDNLYDSSVKHWTGRDFPLLGVIRVDGTNYRFMGKETEKETYFNRNAKQLSADVQPMQTIYKFACGRVNLDLIFTAPLFLKNLDLLSRPVNYITYRISSNDGKKHNISFYFEASPEWALDNDKQESVAKTFNDGQLTFLCSGSKEQKILQKKGDDVRIDWGYFYLASNKSNSKAVIGNASQLRKGFINNKLSSYPSNGYSKLAMSIKLGDVKQADNHLLIGYDDLYSIQYFGKNLRPYWNRNNDETIISQFNKAEKEYSTVMNECKTFDNQLMSKAENAGGEKYADLCALAYRQCIAAQKLVQAPDGDLLFFPKENFSNGSIGTVDVIYPSSPLLLLYNPKLVEGMLNYIFYYSESGQWTKPFAAHDVGTYPIANGQTYGGDMPVEESGNMLILTAAITKMEGNAGYAEKHWKVLTEWAEYLLQKGFNPDDQLCTDDFAGHIAHNTNLSIKAILGIASYGYLAEMLGKKDVAFSYMSKAKEMAAQWVCLASDRDHYRLTFDKEGTWSQKYNMVWDKLLGFDLFPPQAAEKEISYYLTKQNKYGLPLDNRKTYTKTDWVMWTATLAEDKSTFEKFVSPIYDFMNETTERIPMSDWIYTDSQNHAGFQARSVVGGYFIKMLSERMKDSIATCNTSTCSGLIRKNFQTIVNNKATDLFVLKNSNNMEVCVTNFGGRIVSVMVPDKEGKMRDVVLGFDSVKDYINIPSDFGASIGRYANRINKGRFTLDGITYQLPINNYGHCLHGGPKGFQYQVYDARQIDSHTLELTYKSKDGEEGFPGNATCKVTMSLTDDNAIDIRYEAVTDKPTVINMTNHSYFNLDGDAQSNADHLLMINADKYTPIDNTFMTTGKVLSVKNTPMDFRTPASIRSRINSNYKQLIYGHGYDHNWILNTHGDIHQKCASLESAKTGIVLDVYTTEPGIQVYTGNFLDGTIKGKHRIVYNHRASVCMETQKYPDSPNKPKWPSPVLRPGQIYHSECIYKFSVDKH